MCLAVAGRSRWLQAWDQRTQGLRCKVLPSGSCTWSTQTSAPAARSRVLAAALLHSFLLSTQEYLSVQLLVPFCDSTGRKVSPEGRSVCTRHCGQATGGSACAVPLACLASSLTVGIRSSCFSVDASLF